MPRRSTARGGEPGGSRSSPALSGPDLAISPPPQAGHVAVFTAASPESATVAWHCWQVKSTTQDYMGGRFHPDDGSSASH